MHCIAFKKDDWSNRSVVLHFFLLLLKVKLKPLRKCYLAILIKSEFLTPGFN